jgi:hypothetical protein
VTAAEVGAVALQELDLLLAENEGGIAGGLFQAQQALGSRFQIVSQPGAANAAGADGDAHQAQLVGDALRAVGRPVQGIVEDLLFNLGGEAVWMRVFGSTLVLDERGDTADLEGASDFVEGVSMVAHDATGFGHVADLLGELEQGQFPSGTLGRGGHLGSSSVIGGWRFQFTSEDRVAAAFFRTKKKRHCRKITKLDQSNATIVPLLTQGSIRNRLDKKRGEGQS